jgi:hypothetical protein
MAARDGRQVQVYTGRLTQLRVIGHDLEHIRGYRNRMEDSEVLGSLLPDRIHNGLLPSRSYSLVTPGS